MSTGEHPGPVRPPASDGTPGVLCDRNLPNAQSPVPHTYIETGEEYGSLADGGSYTILTCLICTRVAYSPLPD